MPENPFNIDPELLKAQLQHYRLKAEFAVKRTIDDAKFRIAVPKERREAESVRAEAFAGEAMSFMNDNLTARLKPVHPNKNQVAVFQFLMDSIEDGNLLLTESTGRVGANNTAFIVKRYRAETQSTGNATMEDRLFDTFNKKFASFTVRWGISEKFPTGFSVFGMVGTGIASGIDFMTFPEKPTVQVVKDSVKFRDTNGWSTDVGVYGNGERIVLNSSGMYENEEVSTTSNYYLIGSFDGEGTGRSYWVYGCNEDGQSKMTARESGKVKETSTQTSRG